MGQSSNSLGFFDEYKLSRMSYDETVSALKELIREYDRETFDEILNNFKKYNDDYKYTKFPLKVLKDLYRKKKLNDSLYLIDELKKEYVKIFQKYYNSHSQKYDHFADILKNAKTYEELIKEQEHYREYKNLIIIYKKKSKVTKLSFNFTLILFNYVRLEDGFDKREFLEKTFKEEFSISCNVGYENFQTKENELFDLFVDKETQGQKGKKEKRRISTYYDNEDYNDNNYNNYSYDNYDNNNNNISDNYHSSDYRHNTYSSSSNRNNNSSSYSSNHTSNTSNKNQKNKKTKVKVIMCYSCKGKNKCPLCGNKIKSRVSLGNLYAHSNCYNEGTCCLCNKKGSGNQVQSICSDCRKSSISKGLTGSARCFICRNLI